MRDSHRREFLKSAVVGTGWMAALSADPLPSAACGRAEATGANVPMLHVTDLYRPHADPDDHWDLACAYALAYAGDAALEAVLVDHSMRRYGRSLDPDVIGINQMNYITGLAVPIGVGSGTTMKYRNDVSGAGQWGVRIIHEVLRKSKSPVIISVLGSSRDVAIAGKKEPSLFTEKCRGIYLNAGTAHSGEVLESNVRRDPLPYAAIFDLPCPIYWMPCFGRLKPGAEVFDVEEFGTYYRFRQDEILPHLSKRVRNFFTYMFKQGRFEPEETPNLAWLDYLLSDGDEKVLQHQGTLFRNMWCTAGFFHAVGKTVRKDGEVIPLARAGQDAVFGFEPIRISSTDDGHTEWSRDDTSHDRFIFRVLSLEDYQPAVTKAMKTLLMTLT